MEKEKRTRGITDVLLILVITILAGTVLILACGASPVEAYGLFFRGIFGTPAGFAEIFVKAWNSLMENKDACIAKWERMRKGKNPLLAYRAEQLIKYADMDVQKFDAEQMHRILECIVIFEMGKISVRYLDGTIVRF